ncbi:MAG: META domain-containing protein [Acidimicrobiia bacterium]
MLDRVQPRQIGYAALIAGLLIAAFLVNRDPSGPPVDPALLAKTSWRIVSINEKPASGWIRFDDSQVSFSSGLNTIGFQYEVDGDRLRNVNRELFSTLAGSLNPYVVAQENRLTRAMTGHMTIEGTQLTIATKSDVVVAIRSGASG